jgi:hypothetical protein
MHNVWTTCRQGVFKLWQMCGDSFSLSSAGLLVFRSLFINTLTYSLFIHSFTTHFSTNSRLVFNLLSSYLYPYSTPPTNTTTKLLNFNYLVVGVRV